MRLENIVALTNATLVTQPSVVAVDGVAFEAQRVKRGNLYIALTQTDIDTAVLNGAYGIIFQGPVQIIDTEIAWIKVASVEEALLRLLRFHLMEKELDVYTCDPITLKLAQQITIGSPLFLLTNSITSLAKKLWDLPEKSIVFYTPQASNKDLFISSKPLPLAHSDRISIMEQTLFETSFIFDNAYYERQLLSPFFIPYVERLLSFFKHKSIPFRFRSFSCLEHFKPLFINNNFQIKEFGASDRVLIFEPDISLIISEISFLRTEGSWAKIIYLLPFPMAKEHHNIPGLFSYHTQDDIVEILKSNDFHFALIAAQTQTMFELFQRKHSTKQLTLF